MVLVIMKGLRIEQMKFLGSLIILSEVCTFFIGLSFLFLLKERGDPDALSYLVVTCNLLQIVINFIIMGTITLKKNKYYPANQNKKNHMKVSQKEINTEGTKKMQFFNINKASEKRI